MNLDKLKPVESDVIELSRNENSINTANFDIKSLAEKFKAETKRDLSGVTPRFDETEIKELIELCKIDKDTVVYLTEQRAPSIFKGLLPQCRFSYNKIKSFIENTGNNKEFLKYLVEAKKSNNEPLNSGARIENLLKLARIDINTARSVADIDTISKDNISSLLSLYKTNPEHYKKLMESGVLSLIKDEKISVEIFDAVGEHRLLSEAILNDIIKMKNNESLVKVLNDKMNFENFSKYVKKEMFLNINQNCMLTIMAKRLNYILQKKSLKSFSL